MRIDPTRGDWIKVSRAYAHCLEHQADNGSRIPSTLRAAAEVAFDIANEMAARDLWDAAIAACWRADA